MAMLVAPESPYGKALWPWEHHQGETHPTDPTIKGMRPTHFQPYPSMLYRVTQKNPWQWDAEIVTSEMEQRNLESRGFVAGGIEAACTAFDASMQELALMAASRNYTDRNVSEAARAEINEAEQASSRHLGEIPAKPRRKYQRKAV